ncbi:hypothetical protein H5087_13425 [Pseudoalteromonas sp. SR43-7]|uniref:hypothetical protein n=1 Tax=unclassified Pseudoalteromonas TaxID=194690 RepID=UPI0013FD4576|nr:MULTISPECIES: hypothetical protein [unclassified Pseudoalteromonas]MBB1330354.1 hypothetical protein [Pseudoalteromonas sp. SR43-7]
MIEKNKITITAILYFYVIFCSISYQWGFWLKFDINILSYITLTEIAKNTVYPALPAVFIFLLFLGTAAGSNSITENTRLEKGPNKIQRVINSIVAIIFIINTSLIIFIMIKQGTTASGYEKLKGIYPFISCLVYIVVMLNLRKTNIKTLPHIGLFTAVFLPTVFFFGGTLKSDEILNDRASGKYVVFEKGICTSTKNEKYKYIEVIDNKVFSISLKDKSLCIRKAENFKLVDFKIDSSTIYL